MKERIINIGPRLKQRRKEMRINRRKWLKSWACRRHIFLILKVEEPIAA